MRRVIVPVGFFLVMWFNHEIMNITINLYIILRPLVTPVQLYLLIGFSIIVTGATISILSKLSRDDYMLLGIMEALRWIPFYYLVLFTLDPFPGRISPELEMEFATYNTLYVVGIALMVFKFHSFNHLEKSHRNFFLGSICCYFMLYMSLQSFIYGISYMSTFLF